MLARRGQAPRRHTTETCTTESAGTLRLPAERVERRLLLIGERTVEVVERRLQRLRRIDHGGQPIVHCIETSDRRLRDRLRACGLQCADGLAAGLSQPIEGLCLRAGR